MCEVNFDHLPLSLSFFLFLPQVGIDGSNIEQGNRTLTLALVWQMMRLHIDKLLASTTDAQIVAWANNQVKRSGKARQMSSFTDQSLQDSLFFLDLEDAIRPGAVDFSLVGCVSLTCR